MSNSSGVEPIHESELRPTEAASSDDAPTVNRNAATDANAPTSAAQISVTVQDDDTLAIDLAGVVDDHAGSQLLDILNRSVVDGVRRVAIDLRQVLDITEQGAAALVECRNVGRRFADGLFYRSDSGPGRMALMAALADLSGDDDLA